jgi:nitroreductase
MMEFARSVSELVRDRISTRTFSHDDLDPLDRSALERACAGLTSGLLAERSSFRLVTQAPRSNGGPRISDYGIIDPSGHFLVGAVKASPLACQSYGYLLEQLVLKATDLGLDTLWVGYFHPEFFSDFHPAEDEVFPAIVIVGRRRPSLKGPLVRLAVRAASRRGWQALFFEADLKTPLSPASCGPWAEALELVRLGPSAGNRQPWRVAADADRRAFHFYVRPSNPDYERRHLHDVDMGIALSHFELGARAAGLDGTWIRRDPALADPGAGMSYTMTWSAG